MRPAPENYERKLREIQNEHRVVRHEDPNLLDSVRMPCGILAEDCRRGNIRQPNNVKGKSRRNRRNLRHRR